MPTVGFFFKVLIIRNIDLTLSYNTQNTKRLYLNLNIHIFISIILINIFFIMIQIVQKQDK
jgi:hypothetical protein